MTGRTLTQKLEHCTRMMGDCRTPDQAFAACVLAGSLIRRAVDAEAVADAAVWAAVEPLADALERACRTARTPQTQQAAQDALRQVDCGRRLLEALAPYGGE